LTKKKRDGKMKRKFKMVLASVLLIGGIGWFKPITVYSKKSVDFLKKL